MDLLLLLFFILKKWKMVIISGIVCAVIAAGYSIITTPAPAPAPTEQVTQPSAADEVFNQRVQAYDDYISENKSMITRYQEQIDIAVGNRTYLEGILAEIENEQADRDAFRKDSKLLNIDPYNVYKGVRTYSVSNDNKSKNLLSEITAAYVVYGMTANADDNETLGELSLCSVSADDNNIIIIKAMGSDEEQVQQYIDKAGKAIENSRNRLSYEIGEHNLTLLDTSIYKTFDSDLETKQNEFIQPVKDRFDISDRINTLTNQINSLYASKLNILKTIKDTQDAKGNLSKATNEPDKSGEAEDKVEEKRMSTPKATMIGFIIGIILCAVFYIFRFVTVGTIKSDNELERRYGISVLGSIGDDLRTSVAVEMINNMLSENDPLIIMGSVGREACQRFSDKIKEKYPSITTFVAGDIANDVDGTATLKTAGRVVIIEKVNESKVNSISHEVEIIKSLGSEILGFVMV